MIACDTDVVVDGRALGKPADDEEARALPGLHVGPGPRGAQRAGRARRRRGALGPGADDGRVPGARARPRRSATSQFGEWRGRSGGYAIQTLGSTLVERIEGSVSNVVGLPVGLLFELAPELFRPD